MRFLSKYPNIKATIYIYLVGILIFTLFRVILVLSNLDRIDSIPTNERIFILLQAFFMGFRFDTVISGYILVFPFILLTISTFLRQNKYYRFIIKFSFYYIFVMYLLAFFICSADIPYFNQFFTRFNISALQWIRTPLFMLKMIAEEPRYWWMIIPFFLILSLFFVILKRIFSVNFNNINKNFATRILFSLFLIFLIFIGIRGRIAIKSPIRVGTAYFCNYAFANQVGLNPVFTFLRSYLGWVLLIKF